MAEESEPDAAGTTPIKGIEGAAAEKAVFEGATAGHGQTREPSAKSLRHARLRAALRANLQRRKRG